MTTLLARIRWRLVGWSMLVIALVVVTLSVSVYLVVAAGLRDEIDRDLRDRATAVTERSAHEIAEAERALGPEGFRGGTFELLADPSGSILANPQRLSPADTEALLSSSAGFADVALSGDSVRAYSQSLEIGGSALRVIVGRSVAPEQQALQRLVLTLLAVGMGALALAMAGAAFLAGRALVPIEESFSRQREFVAEASHELRTPLTVLRAATDLLDKHRSEPLDRNIELLSDMRHELDRTDRLVDDLLTLARTDLGELSLAVGRVDLGALVSSTVRRASGLASRHAASLEHRAEGSVEPVVEGDPDRLEQAVLVLVNNALAHAGENGHVLVTTAAERAEAVVRVRDDGPGIPRAELERIFDRFYRGATTRSDRRGAGLGLAIARSLVQAHGGSLAIDSAPGSGTVATMRLPLAS